MAMRVYLLVKWEQTLDYVQHHAIMNAVDLVQPVGEMHAGKLVLVKLSEEVRRRARIVTISDDYECLKTQMMTLTEKMTNSRYDEKNKNQNSLDGTIQKLVNVLRRRASSDSRVSERSSTPYQWESQWEENGSSKMSLRGMRPALRGSRPRCSYVTAPNPRRFIEEEQETMDQVHEHIKHTEVNYSEVNNFMQVLAEKLAQIEKSLSPAVLDATFQEPDYLDETPMETEAEVTLVSSAVSPEAKKTLRERKSFEVNKVNEDTDSEDMVKIGVGRTEVPRHVMNQIDWRSHTIATRKLLTAVFPRKILATRSLTGKSSPAFTNKPPKLSLDPVKVKDIVITVSSKCKVTNSQVRSAITTKCADENKMFRAREAKKNNNKKKKTENIENIPPVQEEVEMAISEPVAKLEKNETCQ